MDFKVQGARPKTCQAQSLPSTEVEFSTTVVNLFRDFLAAQQRRDDVLQGELRGLQASLGKSQQPVHQPVQPSPSDRSFSSAEVDSHRLDLPTPGPRRGGQYGVTEPRRPMPFSPDRFGNSSVGPSAVQRKEPKMPVYQQGEDIENYLLHFERMAKTWQWPREEWACRLIPLLTGKALEAYAAMDEDSSNCYTDLREALLVKFDISAETYRQRFRANSTPPGETPTETYHRLRGLERSGGERINWWRR